MIKNDKKIPNVIGLVTLACELRVLEYFRPKKS